jgi:membrane-bound lytic murein transglycosylase D
MRYFFLFSILCCLLFACTSTATKVSVINNDTFSPNSLPDLPDKMSFCGQTINLEDEDIRERLDREILVNVYYQSSTLQAFKRANRFFPAMEKVLKENGVPDDFKYLAVIESNLMQAVSPAGAQGFWQFMPGTAAEYNLLINNEVDERLNIKKSTVAACRYLKFANDTLKDWILAAAAYNRGVGGVRSDMRWQRTKNYFDTHMNSETSRYVFRILAMKLILENPEKFAYNLKEIKVYKPFRTFSVPIKESIANLAEWSIENGINYKILLKLNPWILTNKLTVKGTTFYIQLPHADFNLKPYEAYK